MKPLTFIDMFAGIGGFHTGFEKAGMKAKGWIEWDKFARQSYSNIYDVHDLYNGKDIQQVKGKDLPNVDLWSFGSPCFTAGNLVQTNNGVKTIKNIKIGDKVLTLDGSYQKVTDTMVHKSNDLYELKVYNEPVIQGTGNHPIYTYILNNNKAEWIPISQLKQGDLVLSTQPITRTKSHDKIINNRLWRPVQDVRKIDNTTLTKVYNLEVANNHTYNINGIIVHNCQNLSVAGKRAGIQGSQSSMFFEVMRLLDEVQKKPSYLIMENVKGLLSSHNGVDFKIVKQEFNKHGYDIEYQVLNSKLVVPQNRERIYIVGHLKDTNYKPIFPISDKELSKYRQHQFLNEILENDVNTKYYLTKDKLLQLLENDKKHTFIPQKEGLKVIGNVMKSTFYNGRVYNPIKGLAPTLTTMKGGNRQPKVCGIFYATMAPDRIHKQQNGRRFKLINEPSFTLTKADRHGIAIDYIELPNKQIPVIKLNDNTYLAVRKLTPLECWRLQGFSIQQFNKAKKAGISDSQLYSQAGNAVTIPVVHCIAEKLIHQR